MFQNGRHSCVRQSNRKLGSILPTSSCTEHFRWSSNTRRFDGGGTFEGETQIGKRPRNHSALSAIIITKRVYLFILSCIIIICLLASIRPLLWLKLLKIICWRDESICKYFLYVLLAFALSGPREVETFTLLKFSPVI